MRAMINGDIYMNSGRVSTCYNPDGLLGRGRWRFQSADEFMSMVKSNGGVLI